MQQTIGFSGAIADVPRDFPAGVRVLCPQDLQRDQCAERSLKLPANAKGQAASSLLLHIFTGGSTGKPQVWAKTRENIFGEGFFLASRYGVTERDCILATIPPYHIYGLLFSVVLPLVSSATVVGDTPSFPSAIARVAEEHKITLLASVPAHYRVLRDVQLPATLRLAFSSAGMLDTADNNEFCRTSNKGVVEVYGSTETGGIATRNRSLGEEYFTAFPTIDWKIIGSRLAVRSPYISPDLPVDAEGFFIAGDRAQAQGVQHFSLQGRADTVTKVGGKRVDLEEISLLIKNASGVIDCVVMALPDSGGREHQIGALIQGKDVNIERIRRILSVSLEPYALPRRIRTIDHIPAKDNGKYDWSAIVQLMNDA
jgi:acyl-coenzyme A synthetase/AMP-(fatty) acid ligase